MGNIFNSPQDFLKAVVDFIMLLIKLITDAINIVSNYIASILGDSNCNDNSLMNHISTFLKDFSKNLSFLIRQVKTMANNTVANLTNRTEIKEIGLYKGVKNNLPSNESNDFRVDLVDHLTKSKVVSLEGKFDTDIQYNMRVNYTIWDDCGNLYKNCSQIYKYNFFIRDPASTNDIDHLIVVPELRDFEDMTPVEVNGTAIQSPIRDMSLKLIYVFTSKTCKTPIDYDPSDYDSVIPKSSTLTGIKMRIEGNIDKSDLCMGSSFTDRVTLSGTLNVCRIIVPN